MNSIRPVPGGVCAAQGFVAGGVHCGIRHNKLKPDLAMIVSENECSAAAVYTRNKVQGAPLAVTRRHLAGGRARAVLCNSGNANTCNPNGEEVALACCGLAAAATGLVPEDFIIASTGVIGQPLALAPFESGVPKLAAALSPAGSADAAQAIMTTDLVPKEHAVQFLLSGKNCRIGGIAKGSGMINPDMATLLCFLTTDAAIAPALLHKALRQAVGVSLNQISVDGDTSTNDMAAILANGRAGGTPIEEENADYHTFCAALEEVCIHLARGLAADGEGATKLLECFVENAPSAPLARAIAKSVVSSDLFKAAMFGQDANWGRALCAIGYTPGDFPVDNITLTLQSAAGAVKVCERSAFHPFSEEAAARVLAEHEIEVRINMGCGGESGAAWGCDLTYDYVKINGDYRT